MDVWRFPEGKTVQHRTVKNNRCVGIWGCYEKEQIEVECSCGMEGHLFIGKDSSMLEGTLLLAGRIKPDRTRCLLTARS